MRFLVFLFIGLVSTTVFSKETISDFKKCYEEKSTKIPDQEQKNFLDSYLKFLESKNPKDGTLATQKLVQLAEKSGSKVPVTWVSLFEGSIELCCSDETSSCAQSFGSLSLSHLYPMVKKGNQAAVNLVLAYSAVVATDGADASGLRDYQALIKSKKKLIKSFNASYKNLLEKHPVNWLE